MADLNVRLAYLVVTKVPSLPFTAGNMAMTVDVYESSYDTEADERGEPKFVSHIGQWRADIDTVLHSPVFFLGELIVIDADRGWEIVGKGRKPYRWDIEYEEFEEIEDAVRLAMQIRSDMIRAAGRG